MNIYINLFLQKNHSYTRHFSCLRQHWKQVAVLSIVRWFLLPDEPEKSCSAWNVRGESLEESQGRRALNTTSCQGFVCRVREGPATQLTFSQQWSRLIWRLTRVPTSLWEHTEWTHRKIPQLFFSLSRCCCFFKSSNSSLSELEISNSFFF